MHFSKLFLNLVFFHLYLNFNCSCILAFNHALQQAFSFDNRLIGGQPVVLGEIPYQLQLRYKDVGHLCGAALIFAPLRLRQVALTAAHCVTTPNTTIKLPTENFQVQAGITQVDQLGQMLYVRRIIVHPQYSPLDSTGSRNDIALIFFKGQFRLNRYVRPIALPVQGLQTTGFVTVSGWGTTNSSNHSTASPILLKANLPIIDLNLCNNWYTDEHRKYVIYPSNICAGFEQGGINTCNGDSGGPVVGYWNNLEYLAGVVSWGSEICEAPKSPSVSTRTSSYISWITYATTRWFFET